MKALPIRPSHTNNAFANLNDFANHLKVEPPGIGGKRTVRVFDDAVADHELGPPQQLARIMP
jgi:hypothetical protein